MSKINKSLERENRKRERRGGHWTGLDWTGGEGVSRLARGRSVGQNDRSYRSPAPLHFPSPPHPIPRAPLQKGPFEFGYSFFRFTNFRLDSPPSAPPRCSAPPVSVCVPACLLLPSLLVVGRVFFGYSILELAAATRFNTFS